MTAKQVQFRHDTDANLSAAVPAAGEPAYNTTTKRAHMGDGVTPGGLILPLAKDDQLRSFTAGVAGGTANALVLTITPVPAAWTNFLTLEWRCSANNTGPAAIEVTGLSGTKTLKKKTAAGLADLAANDMIADATYRGVYNGTYVVVEALNASSGLVSVSQGNLNTSVGTFSSNIPAGTGDFIIGTTSVTKPGGQYGFSIETRQSNATALSIWGWVEGRLNSTSFAATVFPFQTGVSSNSLSVIGQQRYITSSPPFKLGDDVASGFIYALVNKSGEVAAHYSADVPPWGYNGPTCIRADYVCPKTGKKYRRAMKDRSLEEIMDGAKPKFVRQLITDKLKNADMELIPHPFGGVPDGHTVVLLDPHHDRLADLMTYQNAGGGYDIADALLSGKIYADNEPLKRKGPPGVMQARLRFRYSGRRT